MNSLILFMQLFYAGLCTQLEDEENSYKVGRITGCLTMGKRCPLKCDIVSTKNEDGMLIDNWKVRWLAEELNTTAERYRLAYAER